jgi:hypothetical protein
VGCEKSADGTMKLSQKSEYGSGESIEGKTSPTIYLTPKKLDLGLKYPIVITPRKNVGR